MKDIIGLINIGNESESESSLISETIKKYNCSLMELTDKDQVKNLDGLIINLHEDSDYMEAFQWLIDIQERYSLFIWIYCPNYNEEMIKLFHHICKTSVIGVAEKREGIRKLSVLIKNAMGYKHHLKKSSTVDPSTEEHYLDSKKLSLVVHKKEIRLTRSEFKVISMLYNQIEGVVTYQEMAEQLFSDEEIMTQKIYRIANIIFRIREKLKEQEHFKVVIIRTQGYQLTYDH